MMEKTMRKIIAVALALIMVMGVAPVSAFAADKGASESTRFFGVSDNTLEAEGKCGEDVSWTYDAETTTLTISGTGDTYDYEWNNSPFSGVDVTKAVIEQGVTSIGASFFAFSQGLTSVTVPDSVTVIGEYAFEGCSALGDLNVSDFVTSIGDDTFYGCDNLNVVCNYGSYIYNYVCERNISHTTLLPSRGQCGENVFWSFDNETGALTISGTGDMYNYDWNTVSPFYNNSEIKAVVIGEGVTNVGDCVFEDCSGLTSVVVPDSVTQINKYAFSCCTSLADVTLGSGVKVIGECAFEECASLATIALPDSLTTVGTFAFAFCMGLTDITIGDEVTKIARDAFIGTGYYNDDANWEDNVLYIGKYLIVARETLTAELTVKDGTKLIADSAFSGREELTGIVLPDSVKNIGKGAFFGTGYYDNEANWEDGVLYVGKYLIGAKDTISGNVAIKDGTVCIADRAFAGCADMEEITVPDSVENIGIEAFAGCTKATVCCNTYTHAHTYAVENNIPFILLNFAEVFAIVTFDANGGEIETPTAVVEKGNEIGELPVPTRKGFSFDGWFTLKTDGIQIEGSKVIEEDVTFYAHWTEIPKNVHSATVNDVTINYKGSANLSLDVTADEGTDYSVSYTSSDSSVATVDDNGKVYGASRGSATVTVTVTDSTGKSVHDTCEVKVEFAWWQWIIYIVLFGWLWGY